MLSSLIIQDFVIVDKLELNFSEGMSVLSGETGAGKSILIDALSLCLGARADSSQIREGCDRANIIAVFEPNPMAQAILKDQAIDCDGELHLRRTIDSKGKSKAFINGVPVPANTLRELADSLIEIHGQHAFQTLGKTSHQLILLDEFGKHIDALTNVRKAFQVLKQAESAFEASQTGQEERQAKLENLRWKLDALESLDPQPGQWEEVVQQHDRLSHGAELLEGTQSAIDHLSQGENAIVDQLNHVIDQLAKLANTDSSLDSVVKNLTEGEILVREAGYELSHYLNAADLDPQSLTQAEQTLSAWHDTARKLRVMPESLPEELVQVRKEMASLSDDLDLDELHAKVIEAREAYEKAAKTLSTLRQQAARQLAKQVTESMQTLSMQGGVFEIAFETCNPSPQGSESVEFRVAGHPGVTPQPVHKVASGGELARISLAITVNTVGASLVPTLIFDEVDSGIGGAVAETVGKYLRALAKDRQVLCVTHLPQVAAQGHHHYQVSKQIEGGETRSRIYRLEQDSRVLEIARMLGGLSISEATKQAAKDLINGGE